MATQLALSVFREHVEEMCGREILDDGIPEEFKAFIVKRLHCAGETRMAMTHMHVQ